jgi:hypothetical protein
LEFTKSVIVKILAFTCLAALAGWAALAIYYSNLPPGLRPVAAVLFGAGSLAAFVLSRSKRHMIAGFFAAFACVLVWWLFIPPTNSRNWQPDVAVLPWADISGNFVTIHNIRNCDYRSETDYTVRHYDKTFDLDKMRSVDFFQVYWGSPLISHTMLSFGFEGGGYVCFSIETRKEAGEEYSALKGFFKQYELTYIIGDERDLVGLRSNYRREDVYLYHLDASTELARQVFLDYLDEVNRLRDQPEWYNALTSNCTTNIRGHTAPYNPNARFDWRIIVNGYIDELLYQQGLLDRSLPMPELKKLSHINARARLAGAAAGFSQLIRQGLPGML